MRLIRVLVILCSGWYSGVLAFRHSVIPAFHVLVQPVLILICAWPGFFKGGSQCIRVRVLTRFSYEYKYWLVGKCLLSSSIGRFSWPVIVTDRPPNEEINN